MPEKAETISRYAYSRADTFSCKNGHFSTAPDYIYDEEAGVFTIKVEPESDSDSEPDGESIHYTSSESSVPQGPSTIYSETIPAAASTIGVNADHQEANYSVLLSRQHVKPQVSTRKTLVQSGTLIRVTFIIKKLAPGA